MRDIAAVAAKVLTSPASHAGRIYELNGPEAVTNAQLVGRISKVANRTVTFVDIPEEAQRKAMLDLGMPAWQVDALLDLQRYNVNGQGGDIDQLLPQLLGRAPVTLDQFLLEFQDSFRPMNPKTGIVIWRIAHRQLAERWAYLTPAQPLKT